MRLIPLFLLLPAALAGTTPAPAPADPRDRGPGIAAQRRGDVATYPVRNFHAIAVGTAGVAEVRVGPAWSLRVAGPPAALANLYVGVERGRLEVTRRWRDRDTGDADRRLRILITMPRLDDVALGGSGRLTVDRVTGERLSAAVGGSGTMAIGRLEVGDATISIGGSGNLDAAGQVRALTVNVGGSGDVVAPRLRATRATVAAAGSGSVRTRVEGPAQVTLVGSGSVDLGPAARCTVTRMGSGTVRCAR